MAHKELTFKEALSNLTAVITRRRWWVLATATVVALGTMAYTLRLPNRYESEAVLAYVPSAVSQPFVDPTAAMPVADRVESMKREILSRTQLLAIIHDFDLYANMKGRLNDDEMAERMRTDVNLKSLEQMDGRADTNAFAITFAAATPKLAQAVNSRLTSLFIEEDAKTRVDQSVKTSNFMDEQLQQARTKMAAQEARVEQFKRQNLSELPEQQTAYVGIVTDLRLQLQTSINNLTRARQDQASLVSQVAGKLAGLNTERASLLLRYTAKHFEVIKKDQEIARTQAILDALRSGATISADAGDATTAPIINQAAANRAEIDGLVREQQKLNAQISQYQNRMNTAPLREQQLANLTRDYEIYKTNYEDLVNKSGQSRMLAGIETSHEGARFHLIDRPSLPTKVSSPQRLKISLVGLAAGLLVGLGLAFLAETRDNTFHDESALKDRFTLPLVVGVPNVLTPSEEQAKSARRTMEWVGAMAMALVVLASEVYLFRRG